MAVGRRRGQLAIDFRFHLPSGRRVRTVELEGPDNDQNRKRVRKKWAAIQYALNSGNFHYPDFYPHGAKVKHYRYTSALTFGEWWDEWIATKEIRTGTLGSYTHQYKNHIGPFFDPMPLSEIGEAEIRLFRKSLTEKGLKENTINTYLKPLCQALLTAHRRKLIEDYPCQDVGGLKERPPEIDPFSFEELHHFLNVLWLKDREGHDLALFMARTGLRPGELIVLRWEHIDYFNRKALVREGIQRHGGIGPPKTVHSIRDVDLRPVVVEALNRQEARTGLIGKWVWTTPRKTRWTPVGLRKRWAHWCRLAGIKYRPPKQMRHTFATLHIAAGENISWVSRMLGHSDVKITLQKYNRFIPNLTRDDGSAFERAFDRRNGNFQVTPPSK